MGQKRLTYPQTWALSQDFFVSKYREFRGVDFFVYTRHEIEIVSQRTPLLDLLNSRHVLKWFFSRVRNRQSSRMSGGWVVRDGPVHRGRAGRGRDGQVWPQ